MIETMEVKKIIISGGGSGGHIFPAIAIADKIKYKIPKVEILFVGAKGRMEMDKVPAHGYKISSIWISGFQRKKIIANILIPIKLIFSLIKSFFIIFRFNPDLVIGTGGYASGPILFISSILNIPSFIQEQNSFPGVTNKILSRFVNTVFVAYEGMEKFFPKNKIIVSGNPVREIILNKRERKQANEFFKFSNKSLTILSIGGSLGALSINNSIMQNLEYFKENNINLLWQTGNTFFEKAEELVKNEGYENIKVLRFINEMDYAYSSADIIISRAGAIAISELCIVGKAVILVPSPNVAENHQFKNAQSLVNNNAAVLVEDDNTCVKIVEEINRLINNKELRKKLSENIKKMSIKNSTQIIYDSIKKIINVS